MNNTPDDDLVGALKRVLACLLFAAEYVHVVVFVYVCGDSTI